MSLNQIPYTNVHELNLDWILQKIQEFDSKIKTFQDIIDSFEENVHLLLELEPRVTALEELTRRHSIAISQLQTDVQALSSDVNTFYSTLTQKLENEANTRASVDNDLQEQLNRLKGTLIDIRDLERRIKLYTDQMIKASDKRTDRKIYDVYLYVNGLYVQIEDQINEILNQLTHVATDVFNYTAYKYSINGRIGFDLNNDLIYQDLHNGLTAEQYCSLGLTADQYAAYHLTARDYMRQSRDLLHYDYVFMPIRGVKQDHSIALDEIINYIMDTMDASKYSFLELTAEEYAALNITAFEYLSLDHNLDHNRRIFYSGDSTGITADQYAHLTLM